MNKRTILVIDDTAENLELMSWILEDDGYDVFISRRDKLHKAGFKI